MKVSTALASLALAAPAFAQGDGKCKKRDVTSERLQKQINLEDLLAGSQKLQDFADANGGNRAFGSGGHNATVDWLYDTLEATGYYDVQKQPFTELFSSADVSFTADGEAYEAQPMTYTPGGKASGKLLHVEGLGCTADEFPPEAKDAIVLLSRGTCAFGAKSMAAKEAGAKILLIYNHDPEQPGVLAGTLGTPLLDYVPTVGLSLESGEALVEATKQGDVAVEIDVDAIIENRVNYNVIAETKQGDHDNVLILGGHSDSVAAGPGINDDGSGTVGVLNVALALTKFKIANAVRFAFWGAEEFGKLGSYYYVKQLNSSDAEMRKMRAYLNFDMIASPNYVLGIYDGDGSAFDFAGPAGSDVIEKDFEDFYDQAGYNHVPSDFTGRSDYAAFIENGIPSGGLFTGAEVIKTEEEQALFGGEAGISYDVNYHQPGDDINNLDHEAYLLNTKSIANSVAKYAMSFGSIPPLDTKQRRAAMDAHVAQKRAQHLSGHAIRGDHGHGHSHAGGACGGGSVM